MGKTRPATLLDSSVVIAAVLSWHGDHEPARKAVEELFESGSEVQLPVRALLESYSVMTRLPAPHRLAPGDAATLLTANFKESSSLLGLGTKVYWGFIERLAGQGVSGGAVYDAEIIECGRRSGATRILTLNRRQFERLAPPEIEIAVPTGK